MGSNDFMALLPLEVAEKILHYLRSEEILICSKVSKLWETIINEDSFWSQLCVQRGLNAKRKESFANETLIHSWRGYHWSMHNWQNKQFTCHRIEDYGVMESIELCDSTLIIPGKNRLKIWNIESVPKLEQELQVITNKGIGFNLKANSNFLVYKSGNIFQIYERNGNHNFTLKKMVYLDRIRKNDGSIGDYTLEYTNITSALKLRGGNMVSECLFALNGSTLAIFDYIGLIICCLKTWNKHTVILPERIDYVFALKINLLRLYLVIEIKKKHVIKVYDISKRSWLVDLLHTSNGKYFMMHPQLALGNQYIVTGRVSLLHPNYTTNVKVWGTEHGNLISILDLPCGSFNCISLNDIIILKISVNVIAVMDPLKKETIRKLTIKDFHYNNIFSFMKAISFNLLVLSYKNYFEVWNWKTGVFLYKTEKNCMNSRNKKVNSLFYIQPGSDDYTKKQVLIYNFRENVSLVNYIKMNGVITKRT